MALAMERLPCGQHWAAPYCAGCCLEGGQQEQEQGQSLALLQLLLLLLLSLLLPLLMPLLLPLLIPLVGLLRGGCWGVRCCWVAETPAAPARWEEGCR